MTEELPEIPGFRYARPLGKNVYLYRGAEGEVAVKLLVDPPRTAEIRTVAELRHPGVVTVHRAGRTRAGLPYLMMRYCAAGDLAAAAPLPFGRVVEIGISVAEALHAAHRAGVVHRDVKPANVLLDERGQVYLTDFGTTGRSQPLWTAPEVLRSGAHSVQADVFSLGATLWHLLVGHSPLVRPRGPRPAFDRNLAPLETLLRQAMAPDPAARPSSAGEFAQRLRQLHSSAPTTGLDAVVLPAEPPARRRPRWPLYAGAAGAAAGVAVTSVLLIPDNGSLPAPAGAQPQSTGVQGGSSGKAVVTATRVNAGTLRFTWTYPSPQAGDKFVWRTNDDLKTGMVEVPSVELAASGTLCVEVRVVRADGGNTSDRAWSPEGCGF